MHIMSILHDHIAPSTSMYTGWAVGEGVGNYSGRYKYMVRVLLPPSRSSPVTYRQAKNAHKPLTASLAIPSRHYWRRLRTKGASHLSASEASPSVTYWRAKRAQTFKATSERVASIIIIARTPVTWKCAG